MMDSGKRRFERCAATAGILTVEGADVEADRLDLYDLAPLEAAGADADGPLARAFEGPDLHDVRLPLAASLVVGVTNLVAGNGSLPAISHLRAIFEPQSWASVVETA